MVASERLRVVRCGGSWLSGSRAAFSADSKYLMCASGDYVKVYRTATEECLHVLQGHSNLVTGIQLNPQNHLQLYSWSLDGTIKLWDFMDGILIKTFVIGVKLFALYALASFENSVFLIIPKDNDDRSGTFQLVSVKLPKVPDQEVEAKELELILDGVSQSPKCTALGREGEYVVSVSEFHLLVCFFKKKKMYRRNFNHKREYTFATMHWHHDEVMDLAFTVEGTTLLSGGIESVLVQWRDGSDAKKEFLPRLGATIQHISVSPDGALLCTSHSDNSSDVKTGLMVDPRTKALVLNGKPGHLQFYSLQNDMQLFNKPFVCLFKTKLQLDIVQQEFIHQYGLNQIELVKAAFDSKGNWLATLEQQQGSCRELELQMKLWVYDEQTQSFTLNTRINMPHEDHITALCFRDTNEAEDVTPTLVTAGHDGHFKVWMLQVDNEGEMEWSAQLSAIILQPDGLSENIAAVSWNSEYSDVYVFKPSEPRPLCIQRKVCRSKVRWAVFVPRDVPECISSEKYQWLSQSQFYFLTETHELMTFSTKTPEERLMPSSRQLAVDESVSMTPFYLLLGKRHQQTKEAAEIGQVTMRSSLARESPAVKELLHTPAHVLPSASFLCPIFLNSLLVSKTNKSTGGDVADEVEMESDSGETESEEETMITEVHPEASEAAECLGDIISKLSKTQERKLRKIRKQDYSWASTL
ncbi:WD repeat-containing protein 75 [Varanus komodoensis]|nr:WD repeat-containing protein 75 [Varanus komodoensis]